MIEIGLALIRQKGRLPHGAFLPWIEAEFGMSQQTSMRFMSVAERYGSIKPSNLELLPPSALYELAAPSTPPEVRAEVEALLVDGAKVTVADIRRMKSEASSAQTAIEGLTARNNDLAAKNAHQAALAKHWSNTAAVSGRCSAGARRATSRIWWIMWTEAEAGPSVGVARAASIIL